MIEVRPDTGSERQLGIVGTLSNADTFPSSFQSILGCFDGGLVHQRLGIDLIGQRKLGGKVLDIGYTDAEILRRRQFEQLA